MAGPEDNKTDVPNNTVELENKKSSFSNKIFNFLAYGGWLLILIVIAVSVIFISVAVKSC